MNNLLEKEREKLLKKLGTIYVPFYVEICNRLPLPFNSMIPKYIIYVFFGLIPYFGLLLLSLFTKTPLNFTVKWIFLDISAIIIAAFSLLTNAYDATCDSLDETIKLLNTEKQIQKLENYIKIMFISKYQLITCIILMLIVVLAVIFMDISLEYPYNIYLIFIAIFASFSAGPGLWLALSSAYFISQLKYIGNLSLNTVNPSQTLGIKKLSKLLTTFSLSFSLELFLFLLIFFLAPWNNIEIHSFFINILVLPLLLFMLFFFMYPQSAIKTIVVNYKEKSLMTIENRISEIYKKDSHKLDDLNLIRGYNDLYKEISGSPNYAIDLNVLTRFISSVAIPLVLILKGNPSILNFIYNFILSFIKS